MVCTGEIRPENETSFLRIYPELGSENVYRYSICQGSGQENGDTVELYGGSFGTGRRQAGWCSGGLVVCAEGAPRCSFDVAVSPPNGRWAATASLDGPPDSGK